MYHHQYLLFDWREFEKTDSSNKLIRILDSLPDEKLIKTLYDERRGKRDDYPIRATWYSLIAALIYQKPTIQSLIRELEINPGLRYLCGIESCSKIPSKDAYHRFMKKLISRQDLIDEIFHNMIEQLKTHIPDLGRHLVIDSTPITTYTRPKSNPKDSSDPEADWGIRKYEVTNSKDDTLFERIKKWFGYSLHILADANYEIPLGYELTRASRHDSSQCLPLIKELKDRHAQIHKDANIISADKAYDDEKIFKELHTTHNIKPVIPLREFQDRHERISVYDRDRLNRCYNLEINQAYDLVPWGYEEKREALKYRCPHAAGRFRCSYFVRCSQGSRYGPTVRIPLKENYRFYTAIARDTKRWKRLYNKRTAIEHINSRLKLTLGLERPFTRGRKRIRLKVGLALVIMLAFALSMAKQGKLEHLRSIMALVN